MSKVSCSTAKSNRCSDSHVRRTTAYELIGSRRPWRRQNFDNRCRYASGPGARPRAHGEINGRFRRWRWDVDRLQQTAGKQPRELARVARIGLDPVARPLRHQSRRYFRALNPAPD
jgi:hypothetical protein